MSSPISLRTADAPVWAQRAWAVPAIIVAGVAIRVAVLPTFGYAGDIDIFVGWVGNIAHDGLSHAYDTQLSFGPVMAFIWWFLGLVDPALVTAAGSADPAVRVVMKLPSVVADFALAGVAWHALRSRPGWATVAIAVLLLHPAIWLVGAWWGTYDSIYVAFTVAAFVLVGRDRNALAVVMLVLALMTKPQAAPLMVPFAGWFIARAGWRGPDGADVLGALRRLAALAAVGILTLAVLWLPFVAADGPANYLNGLAHYQGESYAVLSMSAWNPWWMVQEAGAGGKLILDASSALGPLSFRVVGYLITGLGLLFIGICAARHPSPRTLALGAAASALVAFEFLTTMHERYAFAVLPMLVFVLDDRRIRWLAGILSLTFVLNVLSSAGIYLGRVIPFHGPVTLIGSALDVVGAACLLLLLARSIRMPEPSTTPEHLSRAAS